jgi:hypothetical protein
MKKKAVTLGVLLSVFSVILGCASNVVKYPDDMKGTIIQAAVIVQYPIPFANPENVGLLFRKSFAEKEAPVIEGFLKTELPVVFEEKLAALSLEKRDKVVLNIIPDVIHLDIPRLEATPEEKKNPDFIKFDFESVKDQIKTPYVLNITLTECEYDGGYYTLNLKGYAGLYEVATGKLVCGQPFANSEAKTTNPFALVILKAQKVDTQENVNKRLEKPVNISLEEIMSAFE